MKKILLSLLFLFISYIGAMAQGKENWPKIGKIFPSIKFNDVQYHPSKQLTLTDLRGKWIILDFWNFFCKSCVEEFPKLDSLQKHFAKDVKVLLVGYTGSQYSTHDDKHIQPLFERVRKKNQLSLSIAYDSVVFHQLQVYSPLKLIIDPKGVLRAVTYRITDADMRSFIAGKEPRLPKAWFRNENKVTYDPDLPFLLNGNGGNDKDFLYRSVLAEFKDYMNGNNQYEFNIKGNQMQVLGASLAALYRFAYTGAGTIHYGDPLYGRVAMMPILELKNQAPFEVDIDLRTGMYAYGISFPPDKSSKVQVMRMMQQDLQKYFGYKVEVENRKMAIWKLVVISKAPPALKLPEDVANYPFDSVRSMLYGITSTYGNDRYVFVDETNSKGKLDIILKCKMDDFQDVRRALRENGFDLVQGEKEMQVVVIKDNPDEN
ncbi:redoxin domain-containing protein [Pedobacter heparinus]|uniref:Alkyl hydroperoxide reductase/ Thiol specific antioxidant/ Mal allergen n=1 Tax=Pedobacter heparinus (strain ATCC 13125 / DSM 2366 / CIP 104194 / JCM 7457 / NBRC 12017 / NCIMB 9290 / NRRL B-14731 / HIM 762-3) TaxID=485917 RepID=C6Y1R3_PEDHD|nr:redoxin domain-containing protein [Pedobacter heparinus]ACU05055.1 alkyl hydroperoxide reductase/ Thiol specific antioxidant/ Mal allergen [Pedobacter heparinus DSM 2366]